MKKKFENLTKLFKKGGSSQNQNNNNNTTNPPSALNALPPDIQLLILAQLQPRDLGKMACVSKQWKKLSEDDKVWNRLLEAQVQINNYSILSAKYIYKTQQASSKATQKLGFFTSDPTNFIPSDHEDLDNEIILCDFLEHDDNNLDESFIKNTFNKIKLDIDETCCDFLKKLLKDNKPDDHDDFQDEIKPTQP